MHRNHACAASKHGVLLIGFANIVDTLQVAHHIAVLNTYHCVPVAVKATSDVQLTSGQMMKRRPGRPAKVGQ